MQNKGPSAALLILLLITVIYSSAASALAQKPVTESPAIHLKAGTFVPGQTSLSLDADLTAAPGDPDKPSYYIVQFQDRVQPSWKGEIEEAGGEILEYIPDFAFKVFMTPDQAALIEQQSNINWVGLFHPSYKLDPALTTIEKTLLKLRPESNADIAQVKQAIINSGAVITRQDGRNFVVLAEPEQLFSLARIESVAWIEPFSFNEPHNEYGAGVILGANTANANGYDGSTQTAAVADTGLGGGSSATAHADLPPGRITAIQNFSAPDSPGCYDVIPDGAVDVDLGHGTHVALSVVGGGASSGEGKSAANAANLVFQAVEEYVDFYNNCSAIYADKYYLIGLPADLNNLLQPAYTAGARIHANSWGSNAKGDYTSDSADVDTFMWNNPDMLVTFSAGNKGADTNTDGIVDDDSIGSPATAKNVLTVGASEGDRDGHYECDTSLTYLSRDAYQSGETCASLGGNNGNALGTAGFRWGFTAEPLLSDLTAGNREQMAPFSSRGPTDDGRIKPDVVAPGTWVLSGYSDLYQEGYDSSPNPQNNAYQVDGYGFPHSAHYKYFGGTSMSNPLAAGAATVVRDFYDKEYGHDASAALVKATLINSAVDLLDENNDGADDNDFPIPNNHEGWGLVRLDYATDNTHKFVDNLPGISTGATAAYEYDVLSSKPLKVSLVWSDYPSSAAAALNLVNDLNLTLRGPGGTPVYFGNVFASGWSVTGGSFDTLNNVENVFIQSPASGTWTIEISGANVPQGPQPFALVVDGAFGGNEIIYVSSESGGLVDGLRFKDEDIIAYDTATGTWSLFFDGSDVGLYGSARLDVDAFHILEDESLLISVSGDTTLPGFGSVDDSDILLFTPTSLGSITAGSFELYFDGSQADLTTTREDINALAVLNKNDLVISTSGKAVAGTIRAPDEDLMRFIPASLGAATSGDYELYFDGSDVGLKDLSTEDIWGVWIDESSGNIYFTTSLTYSVDGASGDGTDIIECVPASLGSSTSCDFSLYWDGSQHGLPGERLDALFIGRQE